MIFVTGGAGFIGANFVLDWLRQSDEKIVNIDKLTYGYAVTDPAVHYIHKHKISLCLKID